MTRSIPLQNGLEAIVDDEDYERVAQLTWHAQEGRSTFYAVTNMPRDGGGYVTVGMHAIINDTPAGFLTDHRDTNGLNNRRSNLRTATHVENGRNRLPNRCGTSPRKGVYWDKQKRRWRSSIRVNGRLRHVGLFQTEDAAAAAYDQAARRHFGEFARTNEGAA